MEITMDMLSNQQYEIINYKGDSFICQARAGCAKSSSLRLKLQTDIETGLIDPERTCLVCFNKEIDIEWKSYKLGISTRTSHNLGCLILGQIMGKLGLISPTKTSMLYKKHEKKDGWNLSAAAKKSFSDVRRKYLYNKVSRTEAIEYLKVQIVKNRGHEKTASKEASMIYTIWGETIATMDTVLSYDDMVFGPLEMIARDPSLVDRIKTSYDLIVVDESQDFTWAQIELIKLMRPRRLYAMLDDCQTIYTFNGASHLNILEYAKEFDCEEFYLTKSRRCPRSVVKYIAQKAVPDFDCFPKNPEGHMCPMLDDTKNLQTMIDMDDIEFNSNFAIISRWNASLMNIGLSLLHAKIPFFYRKSIAEDLARFMKTEAKKAKFKTHLNMMNQFKKHLTGVLETREKLLEEKGSKISDWEKELFYSAIEICSNTQWQDTYTNIDLLCKDIKRMGKDKKGLVLITGHGSKGLEYNNVIVVDPHKVEAQAITEGGKCPQSTEFNIWYVMHSRTKLNLWQRKSETVQEWISKYHSGEIYE